ncbi:MAG TPA: hypothetical protein VK335_15565 [Bryobacteraceae bacterium]|nr:hypothetical protein [Bryobacteraceae bacterium]
MTGQRLKHSAQKLRVYESVHSLNQGFEQVLADLVRLQRFPFFRHGHLRGVQVLVEETRTWANFELLGVMHDREQNDWTRFGRLRRQWEKRYEDPDDMATTAAGLKRKPAKSAAKRQAKGSKGARHD